MPPGRGSRRPRPGRAGTRPRRRPWRSGGGRRTGQATSPRRRGSRRGLEGDGGRGLHAQLVCDTRPSFLVAAAAAAIADGQPTQDYPAGRARALWLGSGQSPSAAIQTGEAPLKGLIKWPDQGRGELPPAAGEGIRAAVPRGKEGFMREGRLNRRVVVLVGLGAVLLTAGPVAANATPPKNYTAYTGGRNGRAPSTGY